MGRPMDPIRPMGSMAPLKAKPTADLLLAGKLVRASGASRACHENSGVG